MDAHFHIWELSRFSEYPNQFPTPEFPSMMRDYVLEEYEREIASTPIRGAVFVQVLNNWPAEIDWLCNLARTHPIIKGVVGGLSIGKGSKTLSAEIEKASKYPEFVGGRYVLNYADADTFLLEPSTHEGLEILAAKNLTFDLVLYPRLLKQALQLARKHPNLKIVVDHCAKPLVRVGPDTIWEEGMSALGQFPNVYCKLSGLVTEAKLEKKWSVADLKPIVADVIRWFGPDRCMFGSDWPVCLLNANSYSEVYEAMRATLPATLSANELKGILENNCRTFYGIKE